VNTRRFLTIEIKLKPEEASPTAAVLAAINAQKDKIKDAIVRLNISLPATLDGQLRSNEIRDALKEAHSFAINRDILRETRLRLGIRTAESITPLEALKAWLETQQVTAERRKILLEYGQRLIENKEGGP